MSGHEVAGIIGAVLALCLLGGILWLQFLSYRLLKQLSLGKTRRGDSEPLLFEVEPELRFEDKDELHQEGAKYD